MSQADIDNLEHKSGLRPVGEYPDHCPKCREFSQLFERQNTCEHNPVTLDFGNMAGHSWRRTYCDRCQFVFPVGTA